MQKEGLYLEQNTATSMLRGGPKAGNEGAMRIAMHYKFSIDHAFNRAPEVRTTLPCSAQRFGGLNLGNIL